MLQALVANVVGSSHHAIHMGHISCLSDIIGIRVLQRSSPTLPQGPADENMYMPRRPQTRVAHHFFPRCWFIVFTTNNTSTPLKGVTRYQTAFTMETMKEPGILSDPTSGAMYVFCVATIPITAIVTGLRFLATYRSGRSVGWEDWFALMSFITHLVHCILGIFSTLPLRIQLDAQVD